MQKGIFKVLVVMVVCSFQSGVMPAQHFFFFQGFASPLYLNPAFAGRSGCPQISGHFTMSSFSSSLYHWNAAYDQPVEKLRGGVGLQFSSDVLQDIYMHSNLDGMYAFDLEVGEGFHLHPAINLGIGHIFVDESNLSFGGTGYSGSTWYFNSGVGLMSTYKWLTAGVSLDHINQPDIGFDNEEYRMPVRLNVQGMWHQTLQEDALLVYGIIYQHHWMINHIIPSVVLQYRGFRIGGAALYRKDEKSNTAGYLAGMAGFATQRLTLGYSYGFRISTLATMGGNVNELTFSCRFTGREDKPATHSLPVYGF